MGQTKQKESRLSVCLFYFVTLTGNERQTLHISYVLYCRASVGLPNISPRCNWMSCEETYVPWIFVMIKSLGVLEQSQADSCGQWHWRRSGRTISAILGNAPTGGCLVHVSLDSTLHAIVLTPCFSAHSTCVHICAKMYSAGLL